MKKKEVKYTVKSKSRLGSSVFQNQINVDSDLTLLGREFQFLDAK